MGRQHTIYLSDITYNAMLNLKKDTDSMSQVIRDAIETCNANKETFDLVAYQQKVIDTYKRRLVSISVRVCNKCHADLVDKGLILE